MKTFFKNERKIWTVWKKIRIEKISCGGGDWEWVLLIDPKETRKTQGHGIIILNIHLGVADHSKKTLMNSCKSYDNHLWSDFIHSIQLLTALMYAIDINVYFSTQNYL